MKNIPGTEYISKNNRGYIVQKYINKKMVYFYFSKSLIECLMVRDLLIANFWDTECIRKKQTLTGEKYIYKDYNGYSVRKAINGKMIHFGYFEKLEEAIVERDLLIANNWDLELACEFGHKEETPKWLVGKYGKNQFQSPSNGRVDIMSW